MKKVIVLSIIFLLIILTLIIIISNALRFKPTQQLNQSSFPTVAPHTVAPQNKTNMPSQSSSQDQQTSSYDGSSPQPTSFKQTQSKSSQTSPSQQLELSLLYSPSNPNLISQKDKENFIVLTNLIPIDNENYFIEYSSILNKYIVTTKGEKGEEVFTAWAKENGVLETLQNKNIAIISNKTITEIHASLPPELQPTKDPQEDSKKAQKKIGLLLNLFNILLSVPQSINSITDNDFLTPTPIPTLPIISSVPLPTNSISSLPSPAIQYNGTTNAGSLFPQPLPPISSKAISFQTGVEPCKANKTIYDQATTVTGVPWYVLAAIHYNEGRCNNSKSLVSGRTIGTNEPDIVRAGGCSSGRSGSGIPIPLSGGGCGFNTLLNSAIYAGNHLKGKIGKSPETFEEVVKAFSRYNGGGNRNCERTPYNHCPKEFYGEDDPYAISYFDKKHEEMYLVYCADLTPCNPPRNYPGPGALTIMRLILEQL